MCYNKNMKKKNKAMMEELSQDELALRKKEKRKNVISAVIDWLMIGTLVLGPTVLTKSRPAAKKVDKNLDLIEEIAPSNNINMDYSNLTRLHPVWNCLSNHLYANHVIPFWAKKIDVNVALDLSSEQKRALQYSIDLLNELNEKTYTNVPTIVLNYGEDSLSKFNVVDINITEETDPDVPYEAVCKSRFYPTLNGVNNLFSNIKVVSKVIKDTQNPTHLSTVLTHELLHAIYGFEDNYTHSNDTETIMNTENHKKQDFLSPNDLYIINAICWNKQLSSEQIKNVEKYYKYFEDRYEKNDRKPVKNLMDGQSTDLTM